jgi:hypothetical protein
MSLRDTQRRAAQRKREEERKKASEKKARDSKRIPASEQKANFDAEVERTLKNMTPAQRAAYDKAMAKPNRRAGGSSATKPPKSAAKPAKPAKDDKPQTFAQKFAAERAAQGAGGTFKWKNPRTGKTDTYSTNRADDKPSGNGSGSNRSGSNGSGNSRSRSNATEKAATSAPSRPRKPRGKVGMNSPQMRKYKADMKKWRESQDKKAAGGRVVAKKAAKKKAAKKVARKKTMARTSVKKKSPRRP